MASTYPPHVPRMTITPAIIARALEGDQEASKLLTKEIDRAARPAIGAVLRGRRIYRSLDAREEMSELLQEVFTKLWESDKKRLRAWDSTIASWNTYVGTIAENHAKDRYNRRREQLSSADDEPSEPPPASEDPQGRAEKIDYYRKILERMKAELKNEKQTEMFHLIIELGLKVDEICKRTEMTKDAVYKWREFFGKLGEQIRNEFDSNLDPRPRKKK